MRPVRFRQTAPWIVLAAVLVAIAVIRRAAARLSPPPIDGDAISVCENPSIGVAADQVHLEPALAPHQSWVAFPRNAPPGARLAVCLGGSGWILPSYSVNATALVVDIQTRWVLSQWLAGDLQQSQRPSAWRLLVCDAPSGSAPGPSTPGPSVSCR